DGIYMPTEANEALFRLEKTYAAVRGAEAVEAKIKRAIKDKRLPKQKIAGLLDLALEKAVITREEHLLIQEAETLRYDAVQVDDFTEEEYSPGFVPSSQIVRRTPLATEVPGPLLNKK